MKYKTAFRLAIKAIGVFLVAFSATLCLVDLTTLFIELHAALGGSGGQPWSWMIGSVAGHSVGIAVGLYLFFRGEWIVNLAIPSNRPYCHECGYELTGLSAEGVCPECGTAYRRPEIDNARLDT